MPSTAHARRAAALATTLLGLAAVAPSRAAESWRLGIARLVVAGEVDGALSSTERGHFNDSEYQSSELRRLRLRLAAGLELGRHVALLAEVRSDDFEAPAVYALYLRVSPWSERVLDLQAGLIPPVFGAFARRTYANENPLIGLPLAYQYLTPVSPNALPRSADDLAGNRGWGARPQLPISAGQPTNGLPLVNALRWDTGVELRVGSRPLQLAVALTQGSASRPRVRDDNDGKQLAGRIAFQPGPGFTLGLSAARGAYLSDDVAALLPEARPGGEFAQTALGMDLEWSRGYWLVRAEGIWSGWETPAVASPAVDSPLSAWGVTAEAKYRLLPGLHVAARADHLGFSEVEGSHGPFRWDAPVSRIEVGGGYRLRRNLVLKAVYQHNWRAGSVAVYRAGYSYDARPSSSEGIVAAQVVLWF